MRCSSGLAGQSVRYAWTTSPCLTVRAGRSRTCRARRAALRHTSTGTCSVEGLLHEQTTVRIYASSVSTPEYDEAPIGTLPLLALPYTFTQVKLLTSRKFRNEAKT